MVHDRHDSVAGASPTSDSSAATVGQVAIGPTRRSTLAALAGGLVFLAGGPGLGRAASAVGPDRTVLSQVTLPGAYQGTAETTYRIVDEDGVTEAASALPAQLFVAPAASSGGVTETNPFTLFVFTGDVPTDSDETLDPGQLVVVSATVDDAQSADDTVVQYWEYTYDESSGEVAGTLTDTHFAEGMALNSLWIPGDAFGVDALPTFLGVGTTMQGSLGESAATIEFSGGATGLLGEVVEFTTTIGVTRVQ